MAPQALHDLIEAWRGNASLLSDRSRADLLRQCADELAALLAPRPEQEEKPVSTATLRALHIAVSVLVRRFGGTVPACDGLGCTFCAALDALLYQKAAAAPRPGAEQADEQASNPMTPDQLQWVLEHNLQIRAGHRVQISQAVEAWRADRLALERLR